MPRFSRYTILFIFMQVVASVFADAKGEKDFEKSDSTPQDEYAANSNKGLQKIESEEPLGYLYISYETREKPKEKMVHNTTRNTTGFVEGGENPLPIFNGKIQGFKAEMKSNESSLKKNVRVSELGRVRLPTYTDRIPNTEKGLLTINRQRPNGDSGGLQVYKPETTRIKVLQRIQGKAFHRSQPRVKGKQVSYRFETSFQKAETQERNRERYMNDGQRGKETQQGHEIQNVQRAKLSEWLDGLSKAEQSMGTGEDTRQNERERIEKSRENEWRKIEHTRKAMRGRVELNRTGIEWKKSERNEVRNAESDRKSALEWIEMSGGSKRRKTQERGKEADGSEELERIGSEWNKGEKSNIRTEESNYESTEGRIEKTKKGEWTKLEEEGEMTENKEEVNRIGSELSKEEMNGFRIGQSNRETVLETIKTSGKDEWRKILGEERKAAEGIGKLDGIRSKLRKDERSEFRSGQSNTENMKAGEGHDKTGQRLMEMMREDGHRVLDVHRRMQGGIIEQVKVGSKGIERERLSKLRIEANIGQQQDRQREGISDERTKRTNALGTRRSKMVLGGLNGGMMNELRVTDRVKEGEVRIQANKGELKESLRKQERISTQGTERMEEGMFRGKAVGGGVIKGIMAEQTRMDRDREGQGMVITKQELKERMRAGMNEYKERSDESGKKERKTGWDKLLGVVGEARD